MGSMAGSAATVPNFVVVPVEVSPFAAYAVAMKVVGLRLAALGAAEQREEAATERRAKSITERIDCLLGPTCDRQHTAGNLISIHLMCFVATTSFATMGSAD